jgi:hypothetical protein
MAAAINANRFAGDEIGLDQEERGLGDLFGTTPSR